jgi:salicylate hydroxylase
LDHPARISIVGGGIGGLTAALALQHFGYRVSVFEQARELREIGAGVAISPNAMHALNFLGVGERVAAEAGPAGPYVTRHFQTGEVLRIRVGNDYVERFGAAYHQVHRVDLQMALASAVRRNDPDCVFLDHCFDALTQDSERVIARFTNGKTFASDVLIGCDGGSSKVRDRLFGDDLVNYTGQVAFRALLLMTNVPPSIQEHPFAMFIGPKPT